MTSIASRVRALFADRAGRFVVPLAMAAPLFIVLPGYYEVKKEPVTVDTCQDVTGMPGVPVDGQCVTVCQDLDDVPGEPVPVTAPVEDSCVTVTVREKTCPLVFFDQSTAELCVPIEID